MRKREVFLNFLGEETPLDPREFASRKGDYFIFSDALPLPEGTYLTHVKKLDLGNHRISAAQVGALDSDPAPFLRGGRAKEAARLTVGSRWLRR